MEEVKNFLTQEECQELIKLIDADHKRSEVVEGGTDRSAVSEVRTSSTCNLSNSNPLVLKVHKKISDYLGIDIKYGESLQGQLYEVGQFFKPHQDFFSGVAYEKHCKASGNRTHTFMIYLNDDFQGGGTHFPTLEKTVEPEQGKGLWWYNMKDGELQNQYMHEGVSVDSGKKYIITSWWREKVWDGTADQNLYEESTTQETEKQKSYIVKASDIIKSADVIESTEKVFTSKDDFPKFTEQGFALEKCPTDVWGIIQDAYNLLKNKQTEESFDGKEQFIVGGGSDILSFDHAPSIRQYIHTQLIGIHEEFSKEKLEPSFVYGIRSYTKNATLTPHTDRIATHHISSIIIVDKDLACGCSSKPNADDWPLDIQGHDGDWYKVYAQPGDMILYESAKCEHGRVEPFGGTFFRNFYVHYKLKDWQYKG